MAKGYKKQNTHPKKTEYMSNMQKGVVPGWSGKKG